MSGEMLEMNPGCTGKSEVLSAALVTVLDREEFQDMTVTEILGVLELLKFDLAKALGRV